MKLNNPMVIVAVVAALALGTSGPALADHAKWMAYSGDAEPNTRWDSADVMFQTPNQAPVEKIYFNGFILRGWGLVVTEALNLEGGTIVSPVETQTAAVLGFWRDCNKDGYIGARGIPASWGSFSVYPRALATVDETICPLGSPYNPVNTKTNQPNGIIDEFRWIGPLATNTLPKEGDKPICIPISCQPIGPVPPQKIEGGVDYASYNDRHDVNDTAARVWADWSFPGGRHVAYGGLTPLPRGTFQDSDGTLGWVDFATQYQLSQTAGPVWTSKPNVGRCGEPPAFGDGTCGLWVGYQANRALNDSKTSEGSGAHAQPIVKVFGTERDTNGDGNFCNDGIHQQVGTSYVTVDDPNPSVHPNLLVQGSLAGTHTNVHRGVNVSGSAPRGAGQCAKAGSPVGGGEGDDNSNEPTHRKPSDELRFSVDIRYRFLESQGFQSMPGEAGGVRGPAGANGVPKWSGTVGWTMRPPRTGWGVQTNMFASFYADVSPLSACPQPCPVPTHNPNADALTALPGGAQNKYTYGAEFCPVITEGPSNVDPATLWDCSRTVWLEKRDLDDRDVPTSGMAPRAILGDGYDLRDVDCYDNTLVAPMGMTLVLVPRVGIADCSEDHR